MHQTFAEPRSRAEILENLRTLGFDPGLIDDSVPDDAVANILKGLTKMFPAGARGVKTTRKGPEGPGEMIPQNMSDGPDANPLRGFWNQFSDQFIKAGVSRDDFVKSFDAARKLYGPDYTIQDHCSVR